jgi:hypothetical protein
MLKSLLHNDDIGISDYVISKEQKCILDSIGQSITQQFSDFSESFLSYLSSFAASFQSQISYQQQELISQSNILEEIYNEKVKKIAKLESKKNKHKEVFEINHDSERENSIINKGDFSRKGLFSFILPVYIFLL